MRPTAAVVVSLLLTAALVCSGDYRPPEMSGFELYAAGGHSRLVASQGIPPPTEADMQTVPETERTGPALLRLAIHGRATPSSSDPGFPPPRVDKNTSQDSVPGQLQTGAT